MNSGKPEAALKDRPKKIGSVPPKSCGPALILRERFLTVTASPSLLSLPFHQLPRGHRAAAAHRVLLRIMNPIAPSTVLNRHDRAAGPAADRSHHRAAANQANAQKSTGPRTPAGKHRSSLNALRHGLTGQTIVLPTEDLAAYQLHSKSFLDEYQPKGATETQLVQFLIDTSWQLNRAAAIETNLLSLGLADPEGRLRADHPQAEAALNMAIAFRDNAGAFANLSTYSQRLDRRFERTLLQLRDLQIQRRKTEERQLDKAAKILKMLKHENLPYQPAEDGFVFSNSEVEAFLQRQDRLERANDHDFESYA
jgi:hypothetical protein